MITAKLSKFSDLLLRNEEQNIHVFCHVPAVFLSALAVLHLTVAGKSTVPADVLETTTAPALSNSTLMAQIGDSKCKGQKCIKIYKSHLLQEMQYIFSLPSGSWVVINRSIQFS